jgi:hypothetical protein
LIACAQLLRDKFWLCEAGDACRREFHLGKVQLLDLLVPDQWKHGGLAQANFKLYEPGAERMLVRRVNSYGLTLLRTPGLFVG